MIDEPFSAGPSFLHTLDPRFRLVMATIFSLTVALARRPETALAGLFCAALLLGLSRPPLPPLMRRAAAVNMFLLFLWAVVPFTMPGETLTAIGPFTVSREGVALVWLVTLKANAIFFAFLALVATMDPATIGQALDRLGAPSRLVFLFLFTYRYLHVLAGEWQRLLTAAKLRGFIPRTNMHTYRTLGFLFGMVLVRAFDRSERVYQAMLLRGFTGRFRTVRRFAARLRDAAAAACFLGLTAGLLAVEFMGMGAARV